MNHQEVPLTNGLVPVLMEEPQRVVLRQNLLAVYVITQHLMDVQREALTTSLIVLLIISGHVMGLTEEQVTAVQSRYRLL
jgi:hypothetical protein